jgi:glutathione reductase (NADPH)
LGSNSPVCLARIGSNVSVYFRSDYPLSGFDGELRGRLRAALEQAGVQFFPRSEIERLIKTDNGYALRAREDEERRFDAVLNATGRIPNTDNLGLENAGVTLTPKGTIPVNSYSATAVPAVYAVGDVTDRKNLTPVAIAEGRAFADTVFGGLNVPFSSDKVATAVFTDPPVGTIGLTEAQASLRGSVVIYETQFRPMAVAFAKRQEYSYMKLVVDADTDEVLGIHMLGPDAPEIIQSLAVAVQAGVTKKQFDETVAVHPTTAEEFVLMSKPARRISSSEKR